MRGPSSRSPDDWAPTRRRVLAGGAITLSAGLAGCLVAGAPDDCDSGHPPPDGFELRNGDPDEYSITVEVVQDRLVTAPTVYEEAFEVGTGAGERTVRVDDVVRYAGRYVVVVRTDADVEASHLWTVAPDRCDGLRIEIEDGRIRFDEPGRIGLV